ncbi:PIN domain-containing protein [uncultured Paludibaculum sp.]|uniref:type II toxin-antitoxin system VapC family toxin n=1 Tax=uncultured Paludibaculum sp. TaxID=1765020 RepID=UPI002AAB4DFB|nr:PIN domain-containing protein [uncultured Paludibaculum sp.]
MSLIVLLDAGPLGMITNPKSSPENEACKSWLAGLAYSGAEIVIPEITDYEVRRELLRAGKDKGLGRLDALKGLLKYEPITTPVMLKAAEFWATARKNGRQSADDSSLDADMVLAAQAGALVRPGCETTIATTNVRHLSLFASARLWREIG